MNKNQIDTLIKLNENQRIKASKAFFIKAVIIHDDKYNYIKSIYTNNHTNIEIICLTHGSFWQTPTCHLKSYGCHKCYLLSIKTKFAEQFLIKAQKLNDNKCDYSKFIYINNMTKSIIICKICNEEFLQAPSNHLQGQGCPKCGQKRSSEKTSKTRKNKAGEKFFLLAPIIHNNKYNYSKSIYVGAHVYIEIICSIHGCFFQTPNNHLTGSGCPKCATKEKCKDLNEYIAQFNEIHNFKYDYSKSILVNNHTNIEIICLILKKGKLHGSFYQTPANHSQGHGCPRCSNAYSKPCSVWLDSLNIPNDKEHREVKIKVKDLYFKVDGFDPITKTVYEFNGDFWHGNPNKFKSDDIHPVNKKTYGELYQKTINRKLLLESVGYKVIEIWQSEFFNF